MPFYLERFFPLHSFLSNSFTSSFLHHWTPLLSPSLSLSLCSKWWLSKQCAGGGLQKRWLSGLHVPRIPNQPPLSSFLCFSSLFLLYPPPFFLDFPSVALEINWQTVSACSMWHSVYFNPNLQLTQERRRRGWEMEKEREPHRKCPMMGCPWGSVCTCRFIFNASVILMLLLIAQELRWRQGEKEQKAKHWMKEKDCSVVSIPLHHGRQMASEWSHHYCYKRLQGNSGTESRLMSHMSSGVVAWGVSLCFIGGKAVYRWKVLHSSSGIKMTHLDKPATLGDVRRLHSIRRLGCIIHVALVTIANIYICPYFFLLFIQSLLFLNVRLICDY